MAANFANLLIANVDDCRLGVCKFLRFANLVLKIAKEIQVGCRLAIFSKGLALAVFR
ncbi:MAG: hypothetical protein Q8L98_00665 [Chlamydiales bacterium]|nr:hypothetical protein [Chlamydiales bacterium]